MPYISWNSVHSPPHICPWYRWAYSPSSRVPVTTVLMSWRHTRRAGTAVIWHARVKATNRQHMYRPCMNMNMMTWYISCIYMLHVHTIRNGHSKIQSKHTKSFDKAWKMDKLRGFHEMNDTATTHTYGHAHDMQQGTSPTWNISSWNITSQHHNNITT